VRLLEVGARLQQVQRVCDAIHDLRVELRGTAQLHAQLLAHLILNPEPLDEAQQDFDNVGLRAARPVLHRTDEPAPRVVHVALCLTSLHLHMLGVLGDGHGAARRRPLLLRAVGADPPPVRLLVGLGAVLGARTLDTCPLLVAM